MCLGEGFGRMCRVEGEWDDLADCGIGGWGYRSPYNPEHMIVKRIIALEGDEVRTKRPYPMESAVVPTGHVWVEGEHPDDRRSLDSNTYGPVAKSLVAGQVKAVVWPWAKTGVIRWQDYRGSPRVQQGKHVFPDQYILM